MPQFDPTFFSPQLFWLAVTFIGLYVLMARVSIPRIGAVLEERQRRIDENLSKAAALKADTDAAIEVYERALAESRGKAQAMIKETVDRMAHEAENRQREVGARLAEQIKAGEARIEAAKAQALASVREVAADVARATVERITGQTPDEARLAEAVATAMEKR
ncbi:MAG: F0F1 ATP synthase subunit B' [Alphaproteobacteria bacterium]|nr:F0F1 ATP synthase subunit B' [Alphaproteobacteria bacterium]